MKLDTTARFLTGGRAAALSALAMLTLGAAACGDRGDSAPEPVAESMPAFGEGTPLPTVTIVEPADGAELPAGDVRVVLGADNVTIVPAGDTAPNSGHHHILLNVDAPPEGDAIPADIQGYVHLGQAQTEYTFENLAPGDYTLVAVIGDFAHRVIPQATDTVRFTVVPAAN